MEKKNLFSILFFLGAAAVTAQNEYDLSGLVHRDDTLGIEGVEVLCPNCVPGSVLTGPDGGYTFEGLSPGTSYTLTPKKTDGVSEGVTVLDMIQIREYILSLDSMANPTRLLAADVNGSGGITTFDLVLIARVIIGVEDQFPLDSWIFLPGNRTFNEEPATQEDAWFMGVKMGDVIREDEVPLASVHPVFSIPPVQASAVGPTEASMAVYGFSEIEGFQMSLSWDPGVLAFNGVSSDILPGFNQSNFNLESPGQLNLFYFTVQGQLTLPDGEEILSLDFTVLNPAGPVAIKTSPSGIPFQVVAQQSRLVQDPIIASSFEVVSPSVFRASAGPNPVVAGQSAQLWVESDRSLELQGLLTTVLGEKISANSWKITAGNSNLPIELPKHPGVYFLRLWVPGAGTQVIRWVVEF
jgi:hypothetical protein